MRNEAEVVAAFKRYVPNGVMWRRIEDSSGALGTWDSWLGRNSRGGWIEFKHTKTKGERPKQRQGQAAFGYDLSKAGVRGFYVIGSSDGHVRVCNELMLDSDWRKYMILNSNTMNFIVVEAVLDWMGILR